MRKVLRWIGIVLGVLVGLALSGVAAAYFIVDERLNRTYDIQITETIPIPDQVDRSRRDWPLALVGFCEGCHGRDLAGGVLSDDFFGTLAAPNLTRGLGGKGGEFTDADWVRALRHGVDRDGKPLVVMPSNVFAQLRAEDLGQIIAYVKSAPPVDKEQPEVNLKPAGRVMLLVGLVPPDTIPAETIDHAAPAAASPPTGVTVEYGKYIADLICAVCHGEDFSGGEGAGEGMNLTPGGTVGGWSEEDFINTIRTGVAPDGEVLDPDEFPWREMRQLSDDQLKAIWLYLRSLPPVETEHR